MLTLSYTQQSSEALVQPLHRLPCPPLQSLGGEGQRGLAGPLVDVLFGRRSPAFTPSPPAWQPLNGGLDESQQRAVSLALAARDVALIHGRLVAGAHPWWVGGWLAFAPRGQQCGTLPATPVLVGMRPQGQYCGTLPAMPPLLPSSLHPCSSSPGPPGTGKTTAVIEVICQEVARGK